MRSWILGSSLLLASTTHALPEISISKRDKGTNGASDHSASSVNAITKRQNSNGGTVGTDVFDVLSWSFGGAYYANITVGTPSQSQTVILDTGSSDLYFDASSAQTCQLPATASNSCQGGTFNPKNSSTYNVVDQSPAFNTTFGDGSTAVGPYASDVVGIGDVLVSPVQFGVADVVNSTTGYSIGLMGIGYSSNEAVQSRSDFYPNMPEILKDAGVINSRLYSIWLNDERSTSGTILFGGIDRSKYTGTLATVDFLPPLYDGQILNTVNQFITTVTGCNATVSGKTTALWSGGSPDYHAYGSRDASLPVLLDTGSTAWSIPTTYYTAITRLFSYIDARTGITSCANANTGDYLSLEFGGKVVIHVDVSQFVVPIVNATTRKPILYDTKGDAACAFLLQPSEESDMGFDVLGDAILRSMYVVFDLDNGQASIAQAVQNSTKQPDIVTVKAGPTGVAAAVGSGVATAASNTWSIAAQVSSMPYSVSTAHSTIGTATGNAAVPAGAQVIQSGSSDSSGGGSGSGSGSGSTSSGAAAGVVIPNADFTPIWITGLWIAGVALGFGVMM
ncbi:acid protease [Lecanosticta acicola]|uniref:Acid protease n=1 Tax=Lecanosticta acicola TaxID=111012 RepID=A0AAI8Z7V9_9PEZI|nr:acid protease [Lecanosticta acicola]